MISRNLFRNAFRLFLPCFLAAGIPYLLPAQPGESISPAGTVAAADNRAEAAAPKQREITAAEDSTAKRLSTLEKILSKLPEFSGYVNLRYYYNDLNGPTNTFDVRRANLTVKGRIVPSMEYLMQAAFLPNPRILDAFIRWNIKDWLSIQAGQFKIPFSLEIIKAGLPLETTESSQVINALTPYQDECGIQAVGRDIGIMFGGKLLPHNGFHLLEYQVGIFNGAGINRTDDNRAKDFSGRLFVNPIRHLQLALSYYNGRYGNNGDLHKRIRSGIGAQYEDNRWLGRAEYIRGNTGGRRSEGYYLLAGYYAARRLQPILRYDMYRSDRHASDTRIDSYTVGFTYYIKGLSRFQVNYTYADRTAGKSSNLLTVQAWASF